MPYVSRNDANEQLWQVMKWLSKTADGTKRKQYKEWKARPIQSSINLDHVSCLSLNIHKGCGYERRRHCHGSETTAVLINTKRNKVQERLANNDYRQYIIKLISTRIGNLYVFNLYKINNNIYNSLYENWKFLSIVLYILPTVWLRS